jgi:hypothetical protein
MSSLSHNALADALFLLLEKNNPVAHALLQDALACNTPAILTVRFERQSHAAYTELQKACESGAFHIATHAGRACNIRVTCDTDMRTGLRHMRIKSRRILKQDP